MNFGGPRQAFKSYTYFSLSTRHSKKFEAFGILPNF